MAWRSMGWWRWPCLLLVLLPFALTPYAGPSPENWVAHGAQTAGPHEITLESNGHLRPGGRVTVRVRSGGSLPQMLAVGPTGDTRHTPELQSTGEGWTATTDLPVPERAAPFEVTILVRTGDEDHPLRWTIGTPLRP